MTLGNEQAFDSADETTCEPMYRRELISHPYGERLPLGECRSFPEAGKIEHTFVGLKTYRHPLALW